jgi:hypothetical protein
MVYMVKDTYLFLLAAAQNLLQDHEDFCRSQRLNNNDQNEQ